MRSALLCLLLTASPTPDVLPPGHKSVQHQLILLWQGDAVPPGHHLVAAPTRGFGGHHDIQAGEPFEFSSKYGTRIYLLPDGTEFPDGSLETANRAWPNATVPVAEVSSIAAGNPLARLESTVEVVRATDDGIEFGAVSARQFDASGNELTGLAGMSLMIIAALGIMLLAMLGWRAARASAATQ